MAVPTRRRPLSVAASEVRDGSARVDRRPSAKKAAIDPSPTKWFTPPSRRSSANPPFGPSLATRRGLVSKPLISATPYRVSVW